MFFDNIEQVETIARRNGTSIFVIPKDMKVEIKNALVLEPEEKTVITIEQVRKMTAGLSLKQTNERFIVVRPADKLGLDAANAFLKNLEEPGEKIHYLLITEEPSRLLPTILSRAAIYFLVKKGGENLEINADEEKKQLAKRLIAANGANLVMIAEEIAKKKNGVRDFALEILGIAIEMLEKSYYITGKMIFVEKLPKFLKAYEKISQNGHVKLQIVANLC